MRATQIQICHTFYIKAIYFYIISLLEIIIEYYVYFRTSMHDINTFIKWPVSLHIQGFSSRNVKNALLTARHGWVQEKKTIWSRVYGLQRLRTNLWMISLLTESERGQSLTPPPSNPQPIIFVYSNEPPIKMTWSGICDRPKESLAPNRNSTPPFLSF